ncbi:MAG TPA: hypothetical protein VI756_09960 [Blastocatellia bacterium]
MVVIDRGDGLPYTVVQISWRPISSGDQEIWRGQTVFKRDKCSGQYRPIQFKSQFETRQLFKSVSLIDTYDPTALNSSDHAQTENRNSNGMKEGSLDSPIGTMADMEVRDTQRLLVSASESPAEDRTLVVVIEVLDYLKGNRLKQLLPLDLGKSILTVRLRYYDRDSGEEIGRQIISGETSGSALLGPVSPRTALSGVADGLVDQVTRRIAESER